MDQGFRNYSKDTCVASSGTLHFIQVTLPSRSVSKICLQAVIYQGYQIWRGMSISTIINPSVKTSYGWLGSYRRMGILPGFLSYTWDI
jgi:hypothetical protein